MQSGGMRTGHRVTMWVTAYREQCLRAMAGCCALLWFAGMLSVGEGTLADQWTKPHCPSGQASNSHQSPHHCVWHCDGIDELSAGGQGGTSSNLDSGTVRREFACIPYTTMAYAQIVPRGPPALSA